MSRAAPCRDCKQRTPGCHAACERYACWKQQRDRLIQQDKEARAADIVAIDQAIRIKTYRQKRRRD